MDDVLAAGGRRGDRRARGNRTGRQRIFKLTQPKDGVITPCSSPTPPELPKSKKEANVQRHGTFLSQNMESSGAPTTEGTDGTTADGRRRTGRTGRTTTTDGRATDGQGPPEPSPPIPPCATPASHRVYNFRPFRHRFAGGRFID